MSEELGTDSLYDEIERLKGDNKALLAVARIANTMNFKDSNATSVLMQQLKAALDKAKEHPHIKAEIEK